MAETKNANIKKKILVVEDDEDSRDGVPDFRPIERRLRTED